MSIINNKVLSSIVFVLSIVSGCASQTKLGKIKIAAPEVRLELPSEKESEKNMFNERKETIAPAQSDDGPIIMNAIRDEDGEMVAHEFLNASFVTARFRNVAERHGAVRLEFQIVVPEAIQDSKWQLRFTPELVIAEDSSKLEDVMITGEKYRRTQLRGYQHYQRFLQSIITDTTLFINKGQLEIFIARNLPELYNYKNDTSRVSDEVFASTYGVTEQEAVRHYTDKLAAARNRRKIRNKKKMFERYVKVPIVENGIELDTVIRKDGGDFVYNYVYDLKTRPGLRKAEILLSGDIYEEDRAVWPIPSPAPLTFYISSLSTLADTREHYLSKVIERHAEANTACYIEFGSGKSAIDERLGYNHDEIGRIKGNLRSLMCNEIFDIDSILVRASASPEGSEELNNRLAAQRSEAISRHFLQWMAAYRDSLESKEGFSVNMDEEWKVPQEDRQQVHFTHHSDGENWLMLDKLVSKDTVMTESEKSRYYSLASISSLDKREKKMQKESYYKYMRQSLYPKLRTVKFDFYLHRKGMTKDTIHTTILDTTYMKGVKAILNRDYTLALEILRDYADYNTAVAYLNLDRNANAKEILERLKPTASTHYMLAIICGRQAESEKNLLYERQAFEHFQEACKMEPSFKHRGNLDPEISMLIRKYSESYQHVNKL